MRQAAADAGQVLTSRCRAFLLILMYTMYIHTEVETLTNDRHFLLMNDLNGSRATKAHTRQGKEWKENIARYLIQIVCSSRPAVFLSTAWHEWIQNRQNRIAHHFKHEVAKAQLIVTQHGNSSVIHRIVNYQKPNRDTNAEQPCMRGIPLVPLPKKHP